jgi:hypothetical protein
VHNCCGACKAIKEAARASTGCRRYLQARNDFVVEATSTPGGTITAADDAGFHVKVE